MNEAEKRDRRFASTLGKGLEVLQAFRPDDRALGNGELARRTGMPRATIARMTFTLTSLGFLERLRNEDRYRLGPAVMALGYTARASLSFLPTAEPIMQRLADDVGALVALAIRDGNAAMLVRCWRPRNMPSIWLTEGHRLPLEHSAPGRSILASDKRSPGEQPGTARDRAELQARGFLLSIGRWNPEVNACAVPFWPDASRAPAAFLCGGQAGALDSDSLEEKVGPLLVDRVHKIEESLGLPTVRQI